MKSDDRRRRDGPPTPAPSEHAAGELEGFFELSRTLLCIAGFDGYFKRLNPAWERTLGFTRAELMAKPYAAFVHPDDAAATTTEGERLADGSETISFENRYLAKDGSWHWFAWSAKPDPARKLIYATAVDVTPRKEAEGALRDSEERLRAVVDTAVDGIITIDEMGTVQSFNQGAIRLFGYQPGEVIGQNVKLLMPPPFGGEHDGYLAHYRRTGQRKIIGVGREVAGRRKDGTVFPMELAVAEVALAGRRLFTGVVRDVTERKRLEDDLRQANANLELANRELEAFSYSVAHDLRAPLRSIDGFSLALLEDSAEKLDEEGRKHLRFVRESAQQMARLIDDLLTLSRVTRSELHRETVDLSALARGAIVRLRRNHPDRQVQVVIREGLEGEGDPGLLTVVLDNLFGNAWKFTARCEEARIEFGVISNDGPPAYFVRDNGAGFDMAFANKLFGVFQRLHAATEFEGTGVGLATVRRIVSRHAGRVWAEGKVNGGATFCFTLNEREGVA